MTDRDLIMSIAEMLYEHSLHDAGFALDEAPRWPEADMEVRGRWIVIASAALTHVRTADGATIT